MNVLKKITLVLLMVTSMIPIYSFASEKQDIDDIKTLLSEYELSVNNYDTNPDIATNIWQTTGDSSFIHPRGHEHGWKNIEDNFYQKTMVDTFVSRKLELVGEPDIHIYGNTAVVEFYWIFHAKFRSDNTPAVTKGRESQVLVKTDGDWKIVQVHYSNMPVTGAKEGF